MGEADSDKMAYSGLLAGPALTVGGTGGSGTRVMGQMLRAAGVCLGENRNGAEDSLDLVDAISELALKGEALLSRGSGCEPASEDLILWEMR